MPRRGITGAAKAATRLRGRGAPCGWVDGWMGGRGVEASAVTPPRYGTAAAVGLGYAFGGEALGASSG